jgi:hypothetical protein
MSKKQVIRMVVLGLLVVEVQVPAARADFAFGKRVDLGPTVSSPQGEYNPVISPNGLELYFGSKRPGGYGDEDIWMSKRASIEDPWGPTVNLGPGINSAGAEGPESISSDGLTLYIAAGANYQMYTATRPAIDAPWGPRVPIPSVLGDTHFEIISPDDLELYFYSNQAGGMGGYDIWVSTRATPNDPWEPPMNLGRTINTSSNDCPASMSPDGLILFIHSDRPSGFGGWNAWMTRRPYKGGPWSAPLNLGPSFNTASNDDLTCVSPDGRWAYISNDAGAVWMAPILPIVDFNGDGKVDGKEVSTMAEHLGENYAPCDIAPFAWGDGVVDANDLKVLAGYIGQEVNDPTLIAHWALDETEGIVAVDSVGGNNMTMQGDPTWQPMDGKVGGALALDGKDDYGRSAEFVLDPSKGPFSVIAWVKGGASGQVIVSQASGADWLYLNEDGKLTTGLKVPGRFGKPLTSDAFMVDGQWHRVAVVSDGTILALHVDGVKVATDTPSDLMSSGGILQIGAGKNTAPGSFWSGLIDDVRVYNRAVAP